MKFAITASDRYLGVWEAFLAQGWEPIKLFTTPVDHRLHHHQAVLQAALARKVDIQLSPITPRDLADLAQQGCEALIVASYSWRIGDWRPYLRYAVNFHPSPLPLGRGPYPQVPAILDDHATWGVSCHQLDADFDTGPILASRHFPLSYQECHESLDFKVQMAAKALATDVAEHFVEYWDHAQPQGAGSYFKHWSAADRTLDWNQSVHDILRRVRAFGPIECMARINDVDIFVRRAVGWEEAHGYVAGAVIHVSALKLLVAVKDGFVGIVEWHLNPPGVPDCAGER